MLQENACCGSEQILTDIRCGALAADDDDADYDDTDIPAELTRPRQNRDTGATIEVCLQRVDKLMLPQEMEIMMTSLQPLKQTNKEGRL